MPRRNLKYTKELLEENVKNVLSFGALLRALGLKDVGGNFRHIQQRCRHHGVNTSHFTGQCWNKGLKAEDHSGIEACRKANSLTFEERFCENSKANTSDKPFRNAAIANGIPYVCAECGNDGTWRGKQMSLDLDHKNGISNDNRLENLRFLCPNCHRQTPTWGKRRNNLTPDDLSSKYIGSADMVER